MAAIDLTSSAFDDDEALPRRFTREGEEMSPPLEWTGVPSAAVELVVLCEDLDAPSGSLTHWIVSGIDPAVEGLEEGEEPPGVVSENDFGDVGWTGPLPAQDDDPHRYAFRLLALDAPLGLGPEATRDDLDEVLQGRVLDTATLVGRYGSTGVAVMPVWVG